MIFFILVVIIQKDPQGANMASIQIMNNMLFKKNIMKTKDLYLGNNNLCIRDETF